MTGRARDILFALFLVLGVMLITSWAFQFTEPARVQTTPPTTATTTVSTTTTTYGGNPQIEKVAGNG